MCTKKVLNSRFFSTPGRNDWWHVQRNLRLSSSVNSGKTIKHLIMSPVLNHHPKQLRNPCRKELYTEPTQAQLSPTLKYYTLPRTFLKTLLRFHTKSNSCLIQKKGKAHNVFLFVLPTTGDGERHCHKAMLVSLYASRWDSCVKIFPPLAAPWNRVARGFNTSLQPNRRPGMFVFRNVKSSVFHGWQGSRWGYCCFL